MFESGEWRKTLAEKRQDRKSERTRQKSERGDRKEESNDSPEIADRGLRHPASPRGGGYYVRSKSCRGLNDRMAATRPVRRKRPGRPETTRDDECGGRDRGDRRPNGADGVTRESVWSGGHILGQWGVRDRDSRQCYTHPQLPASDCSEAVCEANYKTVSLIRKLVKSTAQLCSWK